MDNPLIYCSGHLDFEPVTQISTWNSAKQTGGICELKSAAIKHQFYHISQKWARNVLDLKFSLLLIYIYPLKLVKMLIYKWTPKKQSKCSFSHNQNSGPNHTVTIAIGSFQNASRMQKSPKLVHTTVIKAIKSMNKGWVRHVAHSGNDKSLVQKSKRKRPLRRHKHRCDNYMNFKCLSFIWQRTRSSGLLCTPQWNLSSITGSEYCDQLQQIR